MTCKKNIRTIAGFVLLSVTVLIFFFMNLVKGSSSISLHDTISALTGGDVPISVHRIIIDIRLPRCLAAMILGGALAVSGFLLQCFFGNPIAGPYVLGISSGAKLAVALAMIFSLKNGMILGSGVMVLASFIGSLISMGLILLMSGKVKNMAQLIISGVMIGYVCSSITELAVTFADDSNIVNLHNWSMGTFSGTDWEDIRYMSVIVFTAFIAAFFISKPLGAYQLGEKYASNMGVNIKLFRIVLILLSSVLSACVTAFAGPVSFVGVAVPHLMKSLFGTSRPLIIIPASFLGGAVVCMACDFVARILFAPVELSISTVTAFFGAPVVIMIMLKRNRQKGSV
ncbi:MAG: iron ABC transporter permease [Ruminococcus sp.]|nr:iron ABC transporter permease [Ruminococcus sp.]